jgi:hypothetical protein
MNCVVFLAIMAIRQSNSDSILDQFLRIAPRTPSINLTQQSAAAFTRLLESQVLLGKPMQFSGFNIC